MLVFLLSFLTITSVFACDFSSKVKNVYSLSGPVTLALKDLSLIQNKKLKGVSVFHPVSKNEFKGEFLPGGVFLSHEKIKSFVGSVVFFDESRELSRILSTYKGIHAVEIKNRSLTPLEVVTKTASDLKPFLSGCDLSALSSEMSGHLNELKKLIQQKQTYLFFLGLIQNDRLPELLMVQDGVVKWMVQEKLILSYPSELPYVNWSSRILNGLDKKAIMVGIKDSGSDLKTEVTKKGQTINLTFPGALIPGEGQVEAMLYLFKYL